MAAQFLIHGWHIVGTARGTARTRLHDLADEHAGRVEIKTLDICYLDQITALHARLSGRTFDMLFVNAGVANEHGRETIGHIPTDEFVHTMVTNALSPMRVLERLESLVTESA